jgi:hypothetical protein
MLSQHCQPHLTHSRTYAMLDAPALLATTEVDTIDLRIVAQAVQVGMELNQLVMRSRAPSTLARSTAFVLLEWPRARAISKPSQAVDRRPA